MIGGTASYFDEATDAVDTQALASLMAEWTRLDADYLTRVDHLLHGTGLNAPYRLDTGTVLEDGVPDLVWGEGGRDVFLVSADDATPDWVATGVDAEFNLARDGANLPPAVALSQAAGQFDPTSGLPIHFTVEFSEPVTGLAADDITVTGDAPGTAVVTVTGSGTTYDVAISGLTNAGTVTVALRSGAAQDADGEPSRAPLTIDDTVTYRPWTNQRKPADVAPEAEFSPYVPPDDVVVTPNDVLYVINYINSHGTGTLPPPPPNGAPAFYDVNGNGEVTAQDVLLVINYINSHLAPGGESESTGTRWAARNVVSAARLTAEGEASAGTSAQTAPANSAAQPAAVPPDFARWFSSTGNRIGESLYDDVGESDFRREVAPTDEVLTVWGDPLTLENSATMDSRIEAAGRGKLSRGLRAMAASPQICEDAVDGWLAGWAGDLSSLT